MQYVGLWDSNPDHPDKNYLVSYVQWKTLFQVIKPQIN